MLILEHSLHDLLTFRDDISGAEAARGLTTWDLHHRAGLAPKERVPRPTKWDRLQSVSFS